VRDRREVTLYIGDVVASREPAVLRTLLGSCVAACLRDPVTRVGGMNHFMLPAPGAVEPGGTLSRFGVHAMELLIGEIQKRGGDRSRLEAKIFGGGHVLDIAASQETVPQQNIRFIRAFLADEGIGIAAQDLGGREARQIVFHTDTGTALLRRLGGAALGRSVMRREREHQAEAERALQYGEVTLFDEPDPPPRSAQPAAGLLVTAGPGRREERS
jgi:chemotaxis protein CheD